MPNIDLYNVLIHFGIDVFMMYELAKCRFNTKELVLTPNKTLN